MKPPLTQSPQPTPASDVDRFDFYDGKHAAMVKAAHGTPVVLVEKATGQILATYPSLAVAFEELPSVPNGVKAMACLGWA